MTGVACTRRDKQYEWLELDEEKEEGIDDALSKKLEMQSQRWDQARCRYVLHSEKYL